MQEKKEKEEYDVQNDTILTNFPPFRLQDYTFHEH